MDTALALDSYGSDPRPAWLEFDWTSYLREVRVDGRAVNVLDVGTGPAILFIHGHNVCLQHWLEQVEAFRHSNRVVAFDLPGFGRSEMPAEVSIRAYADAAAAVCAQLGIESATVVGNSMGGLIAAEVAISHPRLVELLVLVSPAGLSDRYMGLPAALISHPVGVAVARGVFAAGPPPARLSRALAARPRGRVIALGLLNARPAAHADRIHPAMVHELASNFAAPAAAEAARALATHELRSRLHQINAPTLIVWGDRDNLIPVRCANEFQRLIPGAGLTIYEDTGHNAMIERPHRFNAELAAFLDAGDRTAPALAA